MEYTFGTVVDGTMEEVEETVTAALAEEGFGVLTRIDVQATLKKKIDVDRDPYVILGACNPNLAHRMIELDEEIGALVRFFESSAHQTMLYFPPHYQDLTEQELTLAREAFLGMDCLNCHASAEQATFDPSVIAPSFVYAKDRLKPSWMERWLLDPGKLMIGTRMPAGLFRQEGNRRVIAGQMSEDLARYKGDHVKLFVRYIDRIDISEAALLKKIKDAEKAAAPAEAEEEEFFDDDE